MNKLLPVTIIIVSIIASFFAGYSLNKSVSTSTEIENLQSQINSLQQQNSQLQEEINKLQTGNGENTQKIVLNGSNGSLTISCTIGEVCDDNYDYRAYQYQDENLGELYLSFKPTIANNYNLQAFKDNFKYADIHLNFPEKSSGSTEAYYQSLNGIREIIFTSYENNTLSGELNFVVDLITYQTPGDCVYEGDIWGVCYSTEFVNYSYTLEFHLIMPD